MRAALHSAVGTELSSPRLTAAELKTSMRPAINYQRSCSL